MQPNSRLVKVDLLDYLFTNVGIYKQLDLQGKKKILNSRPQPVLDVVLDVVGDKKFVCPFKTQYYVDYPWMTACPKRNVLFCFVCLLQGKTVASVICTKDDIVRAALAHETTISHMSSYDACLFSVLDVKKETNDNKRRLDLKRRQIVVKLLQTSFVVKCSAYFERIGRRREFHRRTLDFLSVRDVNMPVDWRDLIDGEIDLKRETAIFEVIKNAVVERIKRELSSTDYVSLQIEDVSESTTKPTVSATFRFVVDDKTIHRFAGFYSIESPFSTIDDAFIRDIAKLWNVQNKLIGVSGDFHSDRLPIRVDAGRPIFRRLSSVYHKSNYLFVKIATEYEEIRRFVGQIQIVANFVKRVVDNYEGDVPNGLKNVELSTIDEQTRAIFDNMTFLRETHKRNKASYVDSMIAEDVERILTNDDFLNFGQFFGKLFQIGPTADACFNCYDLETITEKRDEIAKVINSLTGENDSIKRSKTQVEAVIGQITVDILNDVDARCEMNRSDDLCRFFTLNSRRRVEVDEMIRLATEGASNVLTPKLSNRLSSRLRIELQTILRDPNKRLSPDDLLKQMTISGSSTTVFPAFTRILKSFLTLPTTKVTMGNDELSTYERIKILARLSEYRDFDFPLVEYDLTMNLLTDQATLDEMIDRLAEDQHFSTLLA